LFYRKPEANTWGVLNVREEFAAAHPGIVRKVLTQYEVARKWAVSHKPELIAMMGAADKLSAAINERQLQRTDMSSGMIGEAQAKTIIEAGQALQAAGVLDASVDVTAVTNAMIDPSYARAIGA
jgi:sulfonate transport system substrate-binding protein